MISILKFNNYTILYVALNLPNHSDPLELSTFDCPRGKLDRYQLKSNRRGNFHLLINLQPG